MAAADRPTPTEIKLHQKSRVLEVSFSDGSRFELPYEFLRVYSPSAEVRGHGPGQEILQTGKKDVDILRLEPVAVTRYSRIFPTGTAPASTPGTTSTIWARIVNHSGGPISSGSRQPGRAASPEPPV